MNTGNCPKCGKPLKLNATGRIGYCSLHKQWYAVAEGSEADAAAQNAADEQAAQQSRLEKERQEQEKIAKEQEERHRSAVKKAAAVVIVVIAVAACVAFFILRPSINYKDAESKLEEGLYIEAFEAYTSLGNYRDASQKAAFSSAMIDIENGNTDAAVSVFADLLSDGAFSANSLMSDKLLNFITNWNEFGLSPETALSLLSRVSESTLKDSISFDEIFVQVHVSLLDQNALNYYLEDVDDDGNLELVVLNPDYSVEIYRMGDDGNYPVTLDKSSLSQAAVTFAEKAEENLPEALKCYQSAYDLSPTDENKAALAECYQKLSADNENTGDMDSAIYNAEQAMLLANTSEAFTYYYDVNLRRCKSNKDTTIAISSWEEFANDNEAAIRKYSAEESWKLDAAQLHLTRASELAAQKDLSCAEELQSAADLGADVSDAVISAMANFDEGLALTKLRILAIDITSYNEELQKSFKEQLSVGILSALAEWKNIGIPSKEIPALFKIADEFEIDLSDIDRQAIYEDAAIDASGLLKQYAFVDWDADGYEEILGIDQTDALCLYGISEVWDIISNLDTGLQNTEFCITDMQTPVVVLVSSEHDSMLVMTCEENKLQELFRESNICRYEREEDQVAFSRLLEGSIDRFNEYSYIASGKENRPEQIGVDWQQDNYPIPESAYDVVQRYFETSAYDIPEEAELLTSEKDQTLFTLAQMSSLPSPAIPGTVDITPYYTSDDEEWFEVSYSIEGQNVRTWIAAAFIDGWRVFGAAETYGLGLDPEAPDYSVPLISLNKTEEGVINSSGDTAIYRLLVPSSGSVILTWKAGENNSSKNAFQISLYQNTPYGNPIITYDLKPSLSRQQTNPIFMSAGVYYVSVQAKTNDAYTYSLTMQIEESANVELESNDTIKTATPINVNTGYNGSMLTSSDVDFFAIDLEEASGLNIVLESSGSMDKAPVYTVELYSASTGALLTSVKVPGNSKYTETGNVYVDSGQYFVKILKGTAWTNEPYSLTVHAFQETAMEAEANDTPETASRAPVNEDIHASIAKEGDVDYYSFELDQDGIVQLQFGFTPLDVTSKTYILSLLDENRKELQKINIGGKESTKVNAPVALSSGTYMIKVENPNFIRQEYTLKIACQNSDFSEKEPNNTLALATELTLGQTVNGVLTTNEDVDYYKISFPEAQQSTVKFVFPQGKSNSTAYVLSIEQNGNTLWSTNIKGDSGIMEAVIDFPAEEFFIKIKSSTWMSAIYELSVQ